MNDDPFGETDWSPERKVVAVGVAAVVAFVLRLVDVELDAAAALGVAAIVAYLLPNKR